jgi:hypothetical protein
MTTTAAPAVCCWCGNADGPSLKAAGHLTAGYVKHVPSGQPATRECVDRVACLKRRGARPLDVVTAKDAEMSSKRIAARLTRMKLGRR